MTNPTNPMSVQGNTEKVYHFHPEYGFVEVGQVPPAQSFIPPHLHDAQIRVQAQAPIPNPVQAQIQAPVQAPIHTPVQAQAPEHAPHLYAQHIAAMEQMTKQLAEQNALQAALIENMKKEQEEAKHAKEEAKAEEAKQAEEKAKAEEAAKEGKHLLGQEGANAPEFTAERLSNMYGVVNDVINGKAEPTQILGLFQGITSDFWKGLACGAGAVLLYNCTPLKGMVAGGLASVLAATGMAQADDNDGFDPETSDEVESEFEDFNTVDEQN